MYVCPKCNHLDGHPKKRWWSGWRYCENGHVLYGRGLGPSLEESFWKSFLKGFARGIAMTGLVAGFALGPAYQAVRGASGLGLLLAIVYLFTSLSLLLKAHFWAGRAGPVPKLVTQSRGRACEFL